MELQTIADKSYTDKRVFLRVDFNVPMENGNIIDDTRIRAAIPTIKSLLQKGASLIITSHLGRPKGKVVPEMSLKPVSEKLSELISREVKFLSACVGRK